MLAVAVTDKVLSSPSFKIHAALTITKLATIFLLKTMVSLGELVLCACTMGGPLLVLVIILCLNVYLILKPFAHYWLVPGATWEGAFARARRDVAWGFKTHAKIFHRHEVRKNASIT